MVRTVAARRVGGATKLVAWKTSTGPDNHSTGGQGSRLQAAWRRRAGARRWPWRRRGAAGGGPGGGPRAPRQENGTRATDSGSGPASPARAPASPATYRPTPVRGPSRGVASSATFTARSPQHQPALEALAVDRGPGGDAAAAGQHDRGEG